jgi:hypothetical protein
MLIYSFASYRHPSVTAFTSDMTGGNLPGDYAPWSPVNNGRTMPLDSLCEQIAESVRQRGYFLLAGGCAYSRTTRDPSLARLSHSTESAGSVSLRANKYKLAR